MEDLYIRDTGETLPPKFFFTLSGFGSFCYMKTPKSVPKRMVALGDGRTAKMYAFLSPVVGFQYRICEYQTFEKALAKIRSEIDAGHRGFEKFIKELPDWKRELSKEDYDQILYHMVRFFGTVPTVPNALRGIGEADTVAFGGGFDKAAAVLSSLGEEYHDTGMSRAAEIFGGAAPVIAQIKEIIVDYLIDKRDGTDELPALFTQAAGSMKVGFEALERGPRTAN